MKSAGEWINRSTSERRPYMAKWESSERRALILNGKNQASGFVMNGSRHRSGG